MSSAELPDALVPQARALEREIARRAAARDAPLLVALDGGSGSGKTTLSCWLEQSLPDAVRMPSDDFYAAHVTDAEWDAMDAAERARRGIEWKRLREGVLEPLLAGRPGKWRRFDWESGMRADGSWGMRPEWCVLEPAAVLLLDGAYSARPELADLVDFAVLVETPLAARHRRLDAREAADFLAGWHARWDPAEALYFGSVRPPEAFDWIVRNH